MNLKTVTLLTLIFFSFNILALYLTDQDTSTVNYELSLKQAEEKYQNGDFEEAIRIYQNLISQLENEPYSVEINRIICKALLALAFTYFTIQQFELSSKQLEKLLKVNPEEELDQEFYPPRFLQQFSAIQSKILTTLEIVSVPEGAEIFIEGIYRGKTPLKIEKIASGEYLLKTVLSGYETDVRRIAISADNNHLEIALKQLSLPPELIEKSKSEAKKKKRFPFLIVAGGLGIITAIIFLLTSKKSNQNLPILLERVGNPFEIQPNSQSIGTIIIENVIGEITSFSYAVHVDFPFMDQLEIYLSSPDDQFQLTLWNRQSNPDNILIIKNSEVKAFNRAKISGTWKLIVKNTSSKTGSITNWKLGITYIPE